MNGLIADVIPKITNLYVDNYGVSDECLSEKFPDKAFEILFKSQQDKKFDFRHTKHS